MYFWFHPQSVPSFALGVGGILNFISQLFEALKGRILALEHWRTREEERTSQMHSQQQTFLLFRNNTENSMRAMWKKVNEKDDKREKQAIGEERMEKMEQWMTKMENRVGKIENRLDSDERQDATRRRSNSATF